MLEQINKTERKGKEKHTGNLYLRKTIRCFYRGLTKANVSPAFEAGVKLWLSRFSWGFDWIFFYYYLRERKRKQFFLA